MEGKRRAMLFDADNTLYQTRRIAKRADLAAMRVLAKHCPERNRAPASLYRSFREIVKLVMHSRQPYQRTRQHSYSLLAIRHGIPQRFVKPAYRAFLRTVLSKLQLMPNLLPFLRYAKRHGYQLCITTEDRSALALAKLRRCRLRNFFSLVITSDTIGVMKPDKRYFDIPVQRLQVKPADCVVFGDDFDNDLAYPKQRGAFTILIGDRDRRAHKRIRSYAGLRKYVR